MIRKGIWWVLGAALVLLLPGRWALDALLLEEDTGLYRDNGQWSFILLGAFVAVDGRFHGMIPKRELFMNLKPGDRLHVRVTRVRQDGKLDLSARDKAYHQINADSDLVLEGIKKHGGRLPFTDKADPQVIAKEFSLSKNAFKRAVGRLLKEGKIEITDQNIIFVEKPVKRLKK